MSHLKYHFPYLLPYPLHSPWSASLWLSNPSHTKSLCMTSLRDSQLPKVLHQTWKKSECCCSLFVRSPKLHCQKFLFPGFLIRGLLAPGVVVTYCLPSWSYLFSFITAYQGWWDYSPAGLGCKNMVKGPMLAGSHILLDVCLETFSLLPAS